MVNVSGPVGYILSGYRNMLKRYQLDVTGDPTALRAAAGSQHAQADKVHAGAIAISDRTRALGADWEATEYTEFTDKATDLSASMVIGTEQVLRQAADRLTSAAGALTDARTGVDAAITKFNGNANVLVTTAKSVPANRVQKLFKDARALGIGACREAQRITLDLSAKLSGTFGQTSGFRVPEDDITQLFRVSTHAPNNARWPSEWPWTTLLGSVPMTKAERKLIDQLNPLQRVDAGMIYRDAEKRAKEFYPEPVLDEPRPRRFSPNGGHANAFKHAYWSALLTQNFGRQWAQAFTTAHETVLGNPPTDESMDLFNNAVGRQIAAENPGADASVLANKVREAVTQGRTVVVDLDGHLRYSDRILNGHTSR